MTAIGKILALLNLVAGLGILTWSVSVYVERPGWFDPAPDGPADKGNSPVNFAQMKAESDALARSAGVASEAWGVHLKVLEEREKLRAERRAAYAVRLNWAHKGHPKDLVDKDNPKSAGKGFYEPVIDSSTKLHDMTLVAGLPKGKAAVGTDGSPLPGLDRLLDTVSDDVAEIKNLNDQAKMQRDRYDDLGKQVRETERRAIAMGIIRDSVLAEKFFLETFEVNVFETRETVFRRERQLRARLKILGVIDP